MNKRLKKFFITIITTFIFISVLSGIFWLVVPISRSHDAVRSYVLKEISLGTDWDRTIKIMEAQNWKIKEAYTDRGLAISKVTGGIHYANEDDMNNSNLNIVGEQCMFVYLGEYSAPVDVAVFAYLAFDSNGKLVEVYIRKDVDSI